MKFCKRHALFLIILLTLTGLRCFLLSQGSFSLPDERRYVAILKLFPALKNLEFQIFLSSTLETTHGRPGAVITWLIPAAIQYFVAGALDLDLFHPTPVIAATSFNLLVSLGVLVIFYIISLRIFGHSAISALATLVYGFLTNSNIYLPHFLPYSTSLLFFLVAFDCVIKHTIQEKALNRFHFMWIGLLCMFGFSVYPGFYFFPVIIFSLLFLRPGVLFSKKGLQDICNFSAGFLLIMIAFESLAFVGDHAYTDSLHALAYTVNQGSHSEGFTFLFKYLTEVEGFLGYALAGFSLAYLAFSLVSISSERFFTSMKYPFLLAIAGLFLHGVLTYFMEFMVFYGRLLHMYFPFLVLGSFCLLEKVENVKLKVLCITVLLVLVLDSISTNTLSYRRIFFPRDVLISHGVNPDTRPSLDKISESDTCDYKSIAPYPARESKAIRHAYTLVNFCYFFPVAEPVKEYVPGESRELLFRGKHFQSLPAYYYEGFPISDRQRLFSREYQIKLYQ